MRIFLLALAFAASSAYGQGMRWRYVEVPKPTGVESLGFIKVNERGTLAGGSSLTNGGFITSHLYRPGSGLVDAPLFSHPSSPVPLRFGVSHLGEDDSCTGVGVRPGQPARLISRWTAQGGVETMLSPAFLGVDFLISKHGASINLDEVDQSGRTVGRYMDPDGSMRPLAGATSGDYLTVLSGIQDSGGAYGGAAGLSALFGPQTLPCRWTNGGRNIEWLTSPHQEVGSVMASNNAGTLFGVVSKTGPHPGWYGVWWSPQGSVERELFLYGPGDGQGGLRSDPGSNHRSFVSLGEDGSIVFRMAVPNVRSRPTYWSATTGFVDIENSTTGLPTGFTLTTVIGANTAGRMVGYIENGVPGQLRGNFYLEPVPEPASIVALAAGMLALLRRRKR